MNDFIKKELIKDIGEKRYSHSLRVAETALKLSKLYNVDREKTKTAAILHDCGKIKDKSKMLKITKDFDMILDKYMKHSTELIHGPLGAKIAEKKYKIKDKEILSSIKYHTTGKENMTLLEKIIYISDYIEPKRNFCGVEEVRELAFTDLNRSIVVAMDKTINFLIKNKNLIHTRTIRARNYLLVNHMRNGGV